MVADFQEFYNLNIFEIIKDVKRVSILAEQLNKNGRVFSKINYKNAWNVTEYLLSAIEFSLRSYIYGMSDKKKRPKAPPKQILPKDPQANYKTAGGDTILCVSREELKNKFRH